MHMDARTKLSDAQLADLKISNNAIREIKGAKLPIPDLEADFANGTLTLRGTAADPAARSQAITIASRIAGVRKVVDQMQTGSAAPAAQARGGRTYTVKKGDTLSEIAQRELGAASRWKEIFEANRSILKNPDLIMPGQVLTLPST
jgi:nucleoid-associated protein YgaU